MEQQLRYQVAAGPSPANKDRVIRGPTVPDKRLKRKRLGPDRKIPTVRQQSRTNFNNLHNSWVGSPVAKRTRGKNRLGMGLFDNLKRMQPMLSLAGQFVTPENLTKAANFAKGVGSFALKPSTHSGLRQISSGLGKLTSGYGIKGGAVTQFAKTMTNRGGFIGMMPALKDMRWENVFSF
jgi:hypothetical protein